MPTATLGDIDLHYEISGKGPLVVLVTGLGGTASFWSPNIAAFEAEFTVLRFDQRGTGLSGRPAEGYTVETLAQDLIRLLEHLGIDHAMFVGHSTGGAIGQVVAAERPGLVSRLVLYGSWASLCPQMRLCMETRRALLATGGVAAYHRASPLFLYPARYVCHAWDAIEADFGKAVRLSTTPAILDARISAVLGFDGLRYVDRIDTPTLVLVAEDDILTPRLASEELAERISGATLRSVAYGGHAFSHCEPAAFSAAVLPFLRDGAGAAKPAEGGNVAQPRKKELP